MLSCHIHIDRLSPNPAALVVQDTECCRLFDCLHAAKVSPTRAGAQ